MPRSAFARLRFCPAALLSESDDGIKAANGTPDKSAVQQKHISRTLPSP
jgi:hypothetical protein